MLWTRSEVHRKSRLCSQNILMSERVAENLLTCELCRNPKAHGVSNEPAPGSVVGEVWCVGVDDDHCDCIGHPARVNTPGAVSRSVHGRAKVQVTGTERVDSTIAKKSHEREDKAKFTKVGHERVDGSKFTNIGHERAEEQHVQNSVRIMLTVQTCGMKRLIGNNVAVRHRTCTYASCHTFYGHRWAKQNCNKSG